jgi:cell wall-associated NlpC family hydrolase
MIGTPYAWGGRTARRASIVRASSSLRGPGPAIQLPRDSDLQLAALGADRDVDPAALARGDLVFFPGHVGIMADGPQHHPCQPTMDGVKAEPLADVIARSAAKDHGPPVSGYKRLR